MTPKKLPKPGDIGFSIIGGWIGFWVGLGQYLNMDGSKYSHCFVVLDDKTVMEAMPGGARIAPLDEYLGSAIFIDWEPTDEQRSIIVSEALKLEGIPYNFLNYLQLALARFKIQPKWLVKRIQDSEKLICSQLVDEVYRLAGVHMFDDGRLPMDVTPGDILNRYLEKDWL